MGGLTIGKSGSVPPKFIRLPSGKLFDCGRKVLVHNITDLQYVCSRLNISEDQKFFILTEYNGEKCLVPIFYPHHPNSLRNRTSKLLIAYYLCEQFHLKCIQLDNPQDCADIKLVSDVVIANKNQLNTSEEDSKALEELLNSEELFTRLLSVLLSIPELTTQWVHVKDQKGQLYQIGINRDELIIHQEFVESLSTRFSWQVLGNAIANRSIVTLPISMSAENAEKLMDFIDVKSSTKMKSASNTANLKDDRNNSQSIENDKNISQQYILKFRLSDAKIAQRLALQLYTICNRVIKESNNNTRIQCNDVEKEEEEDENTTSGMLTRFNRQFRDTFRCFSRPFNMKSKVSKRKPCSTLLDPNKTTQSVNNNNNNVEATITVQPSSISDHSLSTYSSMFPISTTGIPTTSVAFVTSSISSNSCCVTMKSSVNDNVVDENLKICSYSPMYSSVQMDPPTMITNQSRITATAHTTFMSNSKMNQQNIITTNHEKIPVVVEPIEVAAGEAQAELNERDKQVLHSLLMNKSSTIVSSVPVNNFSYTIANTSMMTTTTPMKSISNELSSSQLSSFNNLSSVAMNKSNSTFHKEPSSISPIINTTITTSGTTTTINQDNLSRQYTNESIFSSSTIPTNGNLATFSHSSSSIHTEMSGQKNFIPSANNSNVTNTHFVKSKLDTTVVEKQISDNENLNLQATSEHVSCVTGPSIKYVAANSANVVSAKNNVASSVDINNNNYNIPDCQNVVNSYDDHNVESTVSHATSLYAPQPYTTVKSDINNNISNDIKPTLNGFKPVMEDDSLKITNTTSISSPSTTSTSDSFQSRIKPPSFTVKTSDLSKISTTKVTSTTVKVDECFNSNHVTQNNNNTMSNSFHTPESIKNHNKTDSPEKNNVPNTPSIVCSASVSVTGIRPPSGIKAPSITPDKMKSRITTNGHTNASATDTSVMSTHDDMTYNKKQIPTSVEPTCELIKRQESITEDSLEHPSSLPRPLGISPSSFHGKAQSKLRPLSGNSPIANSGIPAPSIMPPVSGQSHMPVPMNNTSIPLPSGIKPPSRSPKSALAKH
ncbi:unnamed protein product [Schistosoma spindalis]|nr:unnamed protein product [Schistosoma spindale]